MGLCLSLIVTAGKGNKYLAVQSSSVEDILLCLSRVHCEASVGVYQREDEWRTIEPFRDLCDSVIFVILAKKSVQWFDLRYLSGRKVPSVSGIGKQIVVRDQNVLGHSSMAYRCRQPFQQRLHLPIFLAMITGW